LSIFDHKKTWHFTVRATEQDCFRAFDAVMKKGPGLRLRAVRWEVRHGAATDDTGVTRPARVATYQKRAGIAAFLTAVFGERAQTAERIAIGSKVQFAAMGEEQPGVTHCAMHLATYGTALGITGDAGYIRAYFRAVTKELRALDTTTQVAKV
jgi:hypothetical protein